MTSILDSKLAATIGRAASGLFLDATLTRDIPGAATDPFDPAAATPTTFACKAIHEEWSSYLKANSLVSASDRKVLILASTLDTTPAPGDKISIRSETFTICPAGSTGQPVVMTDPAKAVWTCRASA